VFEDMERMLESMQRSFFGGMMGFGGRWIPALDVRDAGQEIVIEAELPGIDPKDVQVECRGDVLVIRGQGEQRREDERAVVRRSGSFLRQIPIPPGVDLERARASSRHGMLTIRLPKTADAREPVKRIPISIESARDTRDKVA
jgi:HSP20 family protein